MWFSTSQASITSGVNFRQKMQVISFNYQTLLEDDYQRPQYRDRQANRPYAPLVIIMPFIQSNKLPNVVITPSVNL